MFDYLGERCPYCNEPFKEGDDVAVCPDCGTPHHRACYAEHGACANAGRHAEGYDWQQSHAAKGHASAGGADTFPCPACGREVLAGSAFCNYCGTPFSGQIAPYQQKKPGNPYTRDDAPPPPPDFMSGSSSEEYYESVMEEVERSKEIDGISVKDWFTYIGASAGYYLGYFKIQDKTGRKTAFTMSAMLFPSLYFLYRKVWLFAALAFAGSMLLSAPVALVYLNSAGLIALSNPALWTTLSNVGSYINIGLNFLWGLFAVHIYRNSSVNHIRTLREKSANETDFQQRLSSASGPSMLAVTLAMGAVMLLLSFGSSYFNLGF